MSSKKSTPKKTATATRTGLADGGPVTFGVVAALIACILVLGIVVYAAYLEEAHPDVYYKASQEDEVLEWATFWAFMLATVLFCISAWYQRKASKIFPWFQLGVAVFCFVVAMEEVSWGQRLLGYRPPEYFLAENFQQELNFHNVMATSTRKLAVKVVLVVYGVILPLLALARPVRERLRRAGIVEPPWQVIPMFFAAFLLYHSYPWSYTGEWIEVLMGFGFFFAALAHAIDFRSDASEGATPRLDAKRSLATVVAAWLLVVALGWVSAVVLRRMRTVPSPEVLAQTGRELEALRRDFASGRVKSKCSLHKRVFSFKEKYKQDYLLEGEYASLVEEGLPQARADYFIDPWNSPYWIRDRCRGDRRVTFIYSFGPNRGRDSDRWQIMGDDIGVYLSAERGPPD